MQKYAFACLAILLSGCATQNGSNIPVRESSTSLYGVIVVDESPTSEQSIETAQVPTQGVEAEEGAQAYAAASEEPLTTPPDASNLDADGLYDLGRRYMEGDGVEKSEVLAVHYLELSAELGKDEAKRVLGLIAIRKNATDPNALSMLEEAAQTSNKAQMQLGFMYSNLAEPKLNDPQKGLALLEQAYRGANPDAAFFVSRLYQRAGRIQEAQAALTFAADHGNAKAQAERARQLAGSGKSLQAGGYYLAAAQQGDVNAMFEYANGLIIQKFPSTMKGRFAHPAEVEALVWFSIAAEKGDSRAAEEVKNLQGVLPGLARSGYTLDDLKGEVLSKSAEG